MGVSEGIHSDAIGTREATVLAAGAEKDTCRFAARLKRDYAADIARDARGFKERVVRLLRRELPPKPGRPFDETVTRATEMRAKGQSWSTIYCQCIPGYGGLDPAVHE